MFSQPGVAIRTKDSGAQRAGNVARGTEHLCADCAGDAVDPASIQALKDMGASCRPEALSGVDRTDRRARAGRRPEAAAPATAEWTSSVRTRFAP